LNTKCHRINIIVNGTCTQGTQHTPKSGGTGFLVSPQLKVLEFVPISHHVSYIRVHQANDKGVNRSAAFVTCYAPTEHRSTTEEILQFNNKIAEVVTQAKKVTGLKSIPIMGDFNFHLGVAFRICILK
jgi:hypothetical protein